MKKYILIFSILALYNVTLSALEADSIESIHLGQIEIYSTKETNQQNTPVSTTLFNEKLIEQTQITSVKDISGKVPNFYLPDYGSAMSNSPYIRGVGSRYSGQSVALYVDNVPYLEKTAFDFELYDLAQIEVLRGPQGTLYGRNSIGGILNMYTLSPLSYQGTRIALTGGNYGLMHGKASYYAKLGENFGVSLAGYYGRHNGYYHNDFTGKKMDEEETAGARMKLAWDANKDLKFEYVADFDYVNQGAFPYGMYDEDTKTLAKPNFNDASNYMRKTLNNSVSMKYIYLRDFALNVSLAHQYFDDEMNIDQDFKPQSIFTLQQVQKQNMLNGEAVIKYIGTNNYKWLVGVNGFGQQLDMEAPVKFKEDGIAFLQRMFPPFMTIKNENYDIPGMYNTTRSGGALFHQSTLDNIITDGLSVTLGVRLDLDNVKLDYETSSFMDLQMRQGPMVRDFHVADTLKGVVKNSFVEFLPKAALKYEWDRMNFVYASASRGYKTGGFNIQMISDLMTEKLKTAGRPGSPEIDVKESIMYQPEVSWNYEFGIHNTFFNRKLRTGLTLFYMDITGLQLTEFIESGAGRKLTNAGSSVSKGFEISTGVDFGSGFSVEANYGFAHATFKHFTKTDIVNGDTVLTDFSGKFVPYAPQHTVNGNLNYARNLDNSFLSQIYGTISYSGIGKIYWVDSNEITEDFYSLIDAKIGVKKNAFGFELWGKNLLNTAYNSFYFESFGNKFFQQGKPLQFGARLTMEL
ncbi:MAG: TonB-dependent receptor [Porphyromonadaceae bacterium]|jgi:outer membrane receptor protein involved in Fe transport|nr:TonB-dependent receptor [Porphyromonadaceae bacterium]